MTVALWVAATIVVQRALGWPGMPPLSTLVILPMVWIVAPALRRHDRNWIYLAAVLGLGWDVMLEDVVGPGGIAWSAAALGLKTLAGFVADRTVRAWIAFGAAGTVLLVVVKSVALAPLATGTSLSWHHLALSALVTGLWCGLAGWIWSLDLATRWRTYRARKLR
jgi:hypothetical protein